ncbi:hypothetical protein HMPREF9123_2681 [Neisseria bacilliformis ATCC BAA-1200]|uniref:Uncharacterized protein n=1 Tax=Neisseria bacilliformis ATCC BAA-1200 TaxID=888742 RepID=F2BG24_9NEIS|nr:hypothetical protein HMPREF9123_2681 [Neisseria bacilliformis ATCC BAA-1200]
MCRPKATHAFFAVSPNPRFSQQPKPRAWLRHTPYLTARGRLKTRFTGFGCAETSLSDGLQSFPKRKPRTCRPDAFPI